MKVATRMQSRLKDTGPPSGDLPWLLTTRAQALETGGRALTAGSQYILFLPLNFNHYTIDLLL